MGNASGWFQNGTIAQPTARVKTRAASHNVYTEEQLGFVTHSPMAFPDYEDLAEQSRSFAQLAAYTSSGLVIEHAEQSEPILGEV